MYFFSSLPFVPLFYYCNTFVKRSSWRSHCSPMLPDKRKTENKVLYVNHSAQCNAWITRSQTWRRRCGRRLAVECSTARRRSESSRSGCCHSLGCGREPTATITSRTHYTIIRRDGRMSRASRFPFWEIMGFGPWSSQNNVLKDLYLALPR